MKRVFYSRQCNAHRSWADRLKMERILNGLEVNPRCRILKRILRGKL